MVLKFCSCLGRQLTCPLVLRDKERLAAGRGIWCWHTGAAGGRFLGSRSVEMGNRLLGAERDAVAPGAAVVA